LHRSNNINSGPGSGVKVADLEVYASRGIKNTVYLFQERLCSFPSDTEEHFIVWICHGLFIPSSPYGYLGCFQVLKIRNKAATNIHVQVFVWI
jgi:hypothetical protein